MSTPAAQHPEAVHRTLVATSSTVLVLLVAGSLVGGVALPVAALAGATITGVVGARLLPACYRPHALLAGHALVVGIVLLG